MRVWLPCESAKGAIEKSLEVHLEQGFRGTRPWAELPQIGCGSGGDRPRRQPGKSNAIAPARLTQHQAAQNSQNLTKREAAITVWLMKSYGVLLRSRRLTVALAGFTGLLFVLALACGGGTSAAACRTGDASPPPAPNPAAKLTLKIGTYTGTGSPQCIRGIGFQPVAVIINGAFWHSSSMEEDSTADFAIGQPNFEDAITSLDPDAFSLGKLDAVNANGDFYWYVAFPDSPDIKIGSYASDGIDDRIITDVGFEPALVFLKWDGLRSAIWRSAAHDENVSSFFHRGIDSPWIRDFEPDGFRLTSNPFVNAEEIGTYHYAAFRDVPDVLNSGTYTGDSTENRIISGIGFEPDWVWIKRETEENDIVYLINLPDRDSTQLEEDGFRVDSDPFVNFDGDTYHYVAWKASP